MLLGISPELIVFWWYLVFLYFEGKSLLDDFDGLK